MKFRVAVTLVLVTACSSASGGPSDPSGPGTSPSADGGATHPGADAASPAMGSDAASAVLDASAPADAACDPSRCASLHGMVKRTATKPTHGGKGPVYVAVFDGNPVTDAAHATVVARTLLPSVDLSADGAQIAYQIDGVPVRSAPYQIIAFLDDANAVSASNPQPGMGDLVSLQLSGGFSGIPVTVAQPGDATLDLPLNAVIP